MASKKYKIAQTIMIGVLGAGAITASNLAHAAKPTQLKIEKCYGVSKSGQNNCGTSQHACSGKANKNNDPNEWVYTLKGNCGRITGGKIKPKDKA